ncbi:response regulator [Methylobacterium sp. Leaf399]|uniref:response regulator n=1 Tax=unclassified Methylobacterium TaxID=2615210 RepID=UPI0006FCB355|nr:MULTISPECIES: response regulator [unclassified Methylobacterium]KQP61598.1 response regulator [Methylobacterium sp. Leaf108]KQT19750.1 response regulator [Methylobacterium sp. Leaf399]KQT80799.1 response regulator [Methylobacterium sp. Leaf466]
MTESRPLNVVIVEDEAILAMELENMLEDAGHVTVGWATCLSEAEELLREVSADLALVDIHLSDGITGIEVADLFRRHTGAPVVFMTANPKLLPEDFAGAVGVIAKPYTSIGVMAMIDYLQQAISAPPPSVSQPNGLTLAPDYRERWSA